MKRLSFFILTGLILLLGACSNQTARNSSGSTNTNASSNSQTSSQADTETSKDTIAIVVTIDGTDYAATLTDSTATQFLLEQLPLEASFRDYAAGFDEKITDLDQPLNLGDGTYRNDPQALDIGYWLTDERIVFYYGDVDAYNGIHVLGRFDSEDALSAIRNLTKNSQVRIRVAE